MAFSSFNLHKSILRNIEKAGFKNPTEIQQQAIPLALEEKDILACAQTGTGKTAAFGLPLANKLMVNGRKKPSPAPQALILTPTRELAMQVLENIQLFTADTHLKSGLVVGGMSYGPQIKMLQKPLDILVATPGRLIDHLQESRVNLAHVKTVILDEADRMLDMGFSKPVETILSHTSKQRQTLLFSATFSKGVEKLAQQFMTSPEMIKLAQSNAEHKNITQTCLYTKDKEEKMTHLKEHLSQGVWQAVIFVKTKHGTERIAKQIVAWGHKAAALHGDMKQNARKRVVDLMHKDKVQILVATDVAARGIDVKGISHVINFDLPQVAEDYIHRIGRTGRAGNKGEALSYITKEEMHLLKDIEHLIGRQIESLNAPFEMPKSAGKKKKEKAKTSAPRRPAKPSRDKFSAPKNGDKVKPFKKKPASRKPKAPRKKVA